MNSTASPIMMTPIHVVGHFSKNPEEFLKVSKELWTELKSTEVHNKIKKRKNGTHVLETAARPFLRASNKVSKDLFTLRDFLATIHPTITIDIITDRIPIHHCTFSAIFTKLNPATLSTQFTAIMMALALLVEQEEVSEQSLKRWVDGVKRVARRVFERYWVAKLAEHKKEKEDKEEKENKEETERPPSPCSSISIVIGSPSSTFPTPPLTLDDICPL